MTKKSLDDLLDKPPSDLKNYSIIEEPFSMLICCTGPI